MALPATRRAAGFTLIELMVVVVIATLLLTIAIPAYMRQVRQSRRTEAKTALLDLAGREETFNATSGIGYTAAAAQLGYTTFNPIGSGYYQVTVCVPASGNCTAGLGMPNPPAAPSYTIVATPLGIQANDTECTAFAVDSTGQQYATGTLGTQQCWAH